MLTSKDLFEELKSELYTVLTDKTRFKQDSMYSDEFVIEMGDFLVVGKLNNHSISVFKNNLDKHFVADIAEYTHEVWRLNGSVQVTKSEAITHLRNYVATYSNQKD